jgi:hypothetical protein
MLRRVTRRQNVSQFRRFCNTFGKRVAASDISRPAMLSPAFNMLRREVHIKGCVYYASLRLRLELAFLDGQIVVAGIQGELNAGRLACSRAAVVAVQVG